MFGLVQLITLDEAVYTSFSVDNLLLSGEERVASAADFNSYLLFCGTQVYFVPAHAGSDELVVLGVNSFFHLKPSIRPDLAGQDDNVHALGARSRIVAETFRSKVKNALSINGLLNFNTLTLCNS